MPLFDRCSEIVDQHLGITDDWVGIKPRYKSPTSLLRMKEDNLPDGEELISQLLGQMMRNWGVAGCPPSSSRENWRFTKHLEFDVKNSSPEVLLERTIASVMGDEWANQIPVDSGLLGRAGKTLDLAYRSDQIFELIELKVASNTPLSAAIQVLNYGLANLLFQINYSRLLPAGSENALLHARNLRLCVLAPVAFYERFEKVSSWLSQFEHCLDRGLHEFSNRFVNDEYPRFAEFCFQKFPADFHWDESRHSERSQQDEVRQAVAGRVRCFQ